MGTIYLKLQREDTVVGAVKIEEPRFLKFQERNRIIIECSENEAVAVLADDHNTIYHLAGKAPLEGIEEPLLDAFTIDEIEYLALKEQMGDDDIIDPPEPSEDDQEDESYMTPEQMRLRIIELEKRATALAEENEFLSDCLIEMSEVVYGDE